MLVLCNFTEIFRSTFNWQVGAETGASSFPFWIKNEKIWCSGSLERDSDVWFWEGKRITLECVKQSSPLKKRGGCSTRQIILIKFLLWTSFARTLHFLFVDEEWPRGRRHPNQYEVLLHVMIYSSFCVVPYLSFFYHLGISQVAFGRLWLPLFLKWLLTM